MENQKNNHTKNSGFSVSASPLNSVKLDIGILFCIGIILLIVVENLPISTLTEIIVLSVYALILLGWVFIRTRSIVKKTLANNGQE